MTLFYAASSGWFYDSTVSQVRPVDAKEITAEAHRLLLDSQRTGHRIVADENGMPISVLPEPSPADKARVALAERIAKGIAINGPEGAGLDATYAIDPASTALIYRLGLYASQFGTFPGGEVQTLPDIDGQPHTFSPDQFTAFLRLVAPLETKLQTQAQVMSQGGVPAWPDQTGDIA